MLYFVQIAVATNELHRISQEEGDAYIMCGDFNTPPRYPGYTMLHTGQLTSDVMDKHQDGYHFNNHRVM